MTEKLADTILDLYRRHGHAWAAMRGAAPNEGAWIDRFSVLLPAGGDVLDTGCGSGLPIARSLVDRGFDVTGIDGAEEMVALFRQNIPEAGAMRMDMRQLALDRRFAGLVAWDSFFHLSPADQRAMFPLFEKHTAAGGVLLFTSGPAAGNAIGELEGEPLYHASLDAEEYRDLLGSAGFRVIDHVIEDPTCGLRTVWLAQRVG